MAERNAIFHVEFTAARDKDGPARELLLRDAPSGLIIAAVTLDAEQFTRAMNGGRATVEGFGTVRMFVRMCDRMCVLMSG